MSVKQTLEDFADSTSLHGVGRVKSSKWIFLKVTWSFLVLAGLAFSCYQIYRLTNLYLQYPVNNVITYQQKPMRFPVVTICSLNPVKYPVMVKEEKLYQVVEKMADYMGIPMSDFNADLPFSVPNHTYSDDIDLVDSEGFVRGHDMFWQRVNYFKTKELVAMSMAKEEFISSCLFRGIPCDAENFTVVRMEHYGICYAYNTEDVLDSVGPEKGLELIVQIDPSQNIPFFAENSGIRVDIHGHDEESLMDVRGISLPAGYQTEIGITKSITKRLPGLTEKCDVNNTYPRLSGCILDCLNMKVVNECFCSPTFFGLNISSELLPCDLPSSIECKDRIIKKSDVSSACPKCKLPCDEENYHTSVSMSGWPTDKSERSIAKRLNLSADQHVFDSYLKFKIYISSLLQTTSTEQEAYGLINFVSDIGGTLGLLVGMSVLSMAEVVELLALIIVQCWRSQKKPKKDKLQTQVMPLK